MIKKNIKQVRWFFFSVVLFATALFAKEKIINTEYSDSLFNSASATVPPEITYSYGDGSDGGDGGEF